MYIYIYYYEKIIYYYEKIIFNDIKKFLLIRKKHICYKKSILKINYRKIIVKKKNF